MWADSLDAVTAIQNQADVVCKCEKAGNLSFSLNFLKKIPHTWRSSVGSILQ